MDLIHATDVLSSNIDFCPFSCKLGDYEIFIYGLGLSTCSDWNQVDFKIQKTFVETTSDDVWKNSNYIQKFSGKELFGLEDQITLQKLNKLRIPQCTSSASNRSVQTGFSLNLI
ncbi:hypothetical protein RhiirC2_783673 [Rhizophagus irregularis]|uniref:Uncharacterized protein n=1 Tax=Rhizophagus irregularis TaxID=588596 RepID=A0A2N1N0E2_9GLOM|nr:hypothetical protein RhiirC2_783673 [Rhizophagus irregularis]